MQCCGQSIEGRYSGRRKAQVSEDDLSLEQVPSTKEETDYDIHISPNYEVITVSWMDTPNWMIHPFLSEVNKEAILSTSKDGFHVINIERRIWDKAIAKLLAEKLEQFEEKMQRKGINTRKEWGELLDSTLKEAQ